MPTVIKGGKVESGVKYVKQNGLYGETFKDWKSLETYLADWLDSVANQRNHGTTRQQPQTHYDQEEKAKMQSYLSPSCLQNKAAALETRQVDKTSLIAWQSNKYSVPMAYQSAKVGVSANAGRLLMHDKDQLLGAQQVINAHAVQYGGISADLLERILTSSRLTATQLRDILDAYQLNPERLSTAPADQPISDSFGALAHYAVLNSQLTGLEESHVVL